MSNSAKLSILFAASEVTPLVKTGGLADVVSALPAALHHRGLDVRIAIPAYPHLPLPSQPIYQNTIRAGQSIISFRVYQTTLETGVPLYLIHTTPGLTTNDIYPLDPNIEQDRFIIFALALRDWLQHTTWQPTIIHGQDWMTGPLIHCLNGHYPCQTILTIHNAKYQGEIPARWFSNLGLSLPGNSDKANQLAIGIKAATQVTTVSPTYAQEILTPEYGYGLEQLYAHLAAKPIGIVNGLDQTRYNPARDPLVSPGYTAQTAIQGKSHHKRLLQQHLNLKINPDIPLFSVVGRASRQKGMDLLVETLTNSDLLSQAQVVIQVGRGTPAVEELLEQFADHHHPSFRLLLNFDDPFSHQIFAGSDFLLMPSKYEPCGLTQLIAMRYGTIPVVRRTGGLTDTVTDICNHPNGRGLTFDNYTTPALHAAIKQALTLYQDKPALHQLIHRDMTQDFSWDEPVKQYLSLYRHLESMNSGQKKE